MEIVNGQASVITNFEAMRLLQQIKTRENKRPKHHKQKMHNLNNVVFEGLKYLKSTPAAHQTEESIKECIEALRPFQLSPAETLQLINTRPTTQVDIEVMIEESEERLPSEERVDELITAVTSSLPERFIPKGKKKNVKKEKEEMDEKPLKTLNIKEEVEHMEE